MKPLKRIGERVWAMFWTAGQANENEISFFDVKRLYDAAYEEKAKARACLATFKTLMAQAETLDLAYRAQLVAMQEARLSRKVA